MRCISSFSYCILFSGFPSSHIIHTRGLRRGDPISPFLFLVCAKGFSTLLRDIEARNIIHGVKIARNVPAISHLFFADDNILFTRVSNE